MMRRVLAFAVVVVLPGCATKSEVRNMPSDSGLAATYTATTEKARLAAKDSITELRYTLKDDVAHAEGWWRILATQGLSSGGAGRIVRVMIEDKKGTVVVRVVVQSRTDTVEARGADAAIAEDVQKRIAVRLMK